MALIDVPERAEIEEKLVAVGRVKTAGAKIEGGIMATKITRDVLESYLNCKYKAHLKLIEQQGVKSDYEALLAESRDEVKRRATEKILARHQREEVERDLVFNLAALKRLAAFFLNATLEDEHASLTCDGLQRVSEHASTALAPRSKKSRKLASPNPRSTMMNDESQLKTVVERTYRAHLKELPSSAAGPAG